MLNLPLVYMSNRKRWRILSYLNCAELHVNIKANSSIENTQESVGNLQWLEFIGLELIKCHVRSPRQPLPLHCILSMNMQCVNINCVKEASSLFLLRCISTKIFVHVDVKNSIKPVHARSFFWALCYIKWSERVIYIMLINYTVLLPILHCWCNGFWTTLQSLLYQEMCYSVNRFLPDFSSTRKKRSFPNLFTNLET